MCGHWSTSVNVTHILYTGEIRYVYIGETIADLNKKPKQVHEYVLRFGLY